MILKRKNENYSRVKSGVRKAILDKYNINNEVQPSYVDEDLAKESLLNEGADPLLISKNLAELKSIKVSKKIQTNLFLAQIASSL